MVSGLVGGGDAANFGGGGKTGQAELVCKAVFNKGIFDGGDVQGVMCGVATPTLPVGAPVSGHQEGPNHLLQGVNHLE